MHEALPDQGRSNEGIVVGGLGHTLAPLSETSQEPPQTADANLFGFVDKIPGYQMQAAEMIIAQVARLPVTKEKLLEAIPAEQTLTVGVKDRQPQMLSVFLHPPSGQDERDQWLDDVFKGRELYLQLRKVDGKINKFEPPPLIPKYVRHAQQTENQPGLELLKRARGRLQAAFDKLCSQIGNSIAVLPYKPGSGKDDNGGTGLPDGHLGQAFQRAVSMAAIGGQLLPAAQSAAVSMQDILMQQVYAYLRDRPKIVRSVDDRRNGPVVQPPKRESRDYPTIEARLGIHFDPDFETVGAEGGLDQSQTDAYIAQWNAEYNNPETRPPTDGHVIYITEQVFDDQYLSIPEETGYDNYPSYLQAKLLAINKALADAGSDIHVVCRRLMVVQHGVQLAGSWHDGWLSDPRGIRDSLGNTGPYWFHYPYNPTESAYWYPVTINTDTGPVTVMVDFGEVHEDGHMSRGNTDTYFRDVDFSSYASATGLSEFGIRMLLNKIALYQVSDKELQMAVIILKEAGVEDVTAENVGTIIQNNLAKKQAREDLIRKVKANNEKGLRAMVLDPQTYAYLKGMPDKALIYWMLHRHDRIPDSDPYDYKGDDWMGGCGEKASIEDVWLFARRYLRGLLHDSATAITEYNGFVNELPGQVALNFGEEYNNQDVVIYRTYRDTDGQKKLREIKKGKVEGGKMAVGNLWSGVPLTPDGVFSGDDATILVRVGPDKWRWMDIFDFQRTLGVLANPNDAIFYGVEMDVPLADANIEPDLFYVTHPIESRIISGNPTHVYLPLISISRQAGQTLVFENGKYTLSSNPK